MPLEIGFEVQQSFLPVEITSPVLGQHGRRRGREILSIRPLVAVVRSVDLWVCTYAIHACTRVQFHWRPLSQLLAWQLADQCVATGRYVEYMPLAKFQGASCRVATVFCVSRSLPHRGLSCPCHKINLHCPRIFNLVTLSYPRIVRSTRALQESVLYIDVF